MFVEMESFETIAASDVGLRANRPFRFCTMYYGMPDMAFIGPGDDPHPVDFIAQRSIIVHVPDWHYSKDIAPHDHGFYEIAIIRRGSGQHVTEDEAVDFTRGDVFIATPRHIHGYRGLRDACKTNLYIEPQWLLDDLKLVWREEGLIRYLLADALFQRPEPAPMAHLRLTEKEMTACEAELADIHTEATNERPSLALFNACFLKILWILNHAFQRDHAGHTTPLHREVWAGAESMEILLRQGESLDVARIAESSGMSHSAFTRLFKENTGLTPREYYQRRRIHVAAAMLEGGEASITIIAHQLGFADTAHFCRLFRRAMGMSPNEYRERAVTKV